MPKPKAEITRRAKKIKLLLMDVDGVLTDGSIHLFAEAGKAVSEIKAFNSLDGAGLRLIRRAGLRTGVITGRRSPVTAARAREVEIDFVIQDAFEKLPAFEQILRQSRLKPEQVCFVGDDITDLPAMTRVGLAVAVPNGHEEVKKRAHYITRATGGRGAVREVVDLLLRAQGRYEKVLRHFLC
jgi:3-deoxy-D-manno-octulosonate 8-phosphate phosphatase (KDO 8-P phosphatase)